MSSARLAITLLAVSTVAGAAVTVQKTDVNDWTDRYDPHFRKYAKRYFGPDFDWRWFKAQAIAESGLTPTARNKSGARGIMQILPRTFREIQEDNPHMKDIDSPRWNIAAGIYYDRQLYKRWSAPPPGEERLLFAFGSYNAGYMRIRKTVRKVAPSKTTWARVEPHVPSQTRHYVRRIRGLMDREES